MALVCDKKSESPTEDDPDVEDGEITDDDEADVASEPIAAESIAPNPVTAGAQPTIPVIPKGSLGNVSDCESIATSTKDVGELQFKDRLSDQERSDDKDRFSDGRERDRGRKTNRKGRGNREDKNHRRMTEAEKSILHLRKREKMMRQREKWDKHHRKDADPLDDDFAKNIEKTLATILNKKEKEVAGLSGEESKDDEEKRGKKRKKENRDKDKTKLKHKRVNVESPRSEEIDENEMLNVRSGSPSSEMRLASRSNSYGSPMEHRSGSKSEESANSENSEEEREERARRRANKNRRKKEIKREKRERDQRRNNNGNRDAHLKLLQQVQEDGEKVCVFYLQGKCQKNDCPYSHEVSPPMKLELCKFYLMDCCAKGENCSYMHSEFPCKFYHTGLQCKDGKDCKFAHGKPLSEGLKQILFKHIETAPRDILQGFPRLSRDEALNLINQTQKNMYDQLDNINGEASTTAITTGTSSPPTQGLGVYRETSATATERSGSPEEFPEGSPKSSKSERQKNKGSRWQQDEDTGYLGKGFNNFGTDLDMRFISGDIDMRTLPPIQSSTSTTINNDSESDMYDDNVPKRDVDIRNFSKDVDHRPTFARNMDVDIRQRSSEDLEADQDSKESALKFELPAATRDLLARITANQKDTSVDVSVESKNQNYGKSENYESQNINWYSDDDDDDRFDDDDRLSINIEDEEAHRREREDSTSEKDTFYQEDLGDKPGKSSFLSPPQVNIQTVDIVNKLGDLSKIDISAEVTKLLSSMSQKKLIAAPAETTVASSSSTEYTTSPRQEGGYSPKSAMIIDPRISKQAARQDPRQQDPRLSDPRRGRQNSTETKEKKSDKISIYEQGGMDMKRAAMEIERDFKSSDTDLRNMPLPFKGMQNYTPATEVDGSVNSHPPMVWKLVIVEVPRPDYSGLKLNVSDAEKTGDPRIRKIFRLSIGEKDSPASPKASPKQSSGGGIRIDPRLRKVEEKPPELKLQDNISLVQMNYHQQIGMLQSSQFYQSLSTNQKLILNQELARVDESGGGGLNDPVLNTLLGTLNLLPQAPQPQIQAPLSGPNMHMGAATSILNNINKMNPMLQQGQGMMGQPGLLGAAPGIPNMPRGMQSEFQMGFDPRGGPGLLGNAPSGGGFAPQFGMDQQPQFGMDQPQFGMDQPQYGGGGYNNDEYYGGYNEGNNMGNPQSGGGHFRGGRGYNNNNRDGRRRGNRDGFRGRGNNRNFHKRGGNRDKGDRNDRDRRGNRGHSPS